MPWCSIRSRKGFIDGFSCSSARHTFGTCSLPLLMYGFILLIPLRPTAAPLCVGELAVCCSALLGPTSGSMGSMLCSVPKWAAQDCKVLCRTANCKFCS